MLVLGNDTAQILCLPPGLTSILQLLLTIHSVDDKELMLKQRYVLHRLTQCHQFKLV
jgi:hypothetical protein